jgi:N-acetylglucosamine kinase-like BadF-type ATPase
VLSRVEGGAGLIDPVDPLSGAADLAALALSAAARVAGAEIIGLCCALAGAGRKDVREGLARAISSTGMTGRVRVIGDGEAAMHDAFGTGSGVLLIAGTGSIAWARSVHGVSVRAGGWGTLLGDEGSGYAIGLAGLRAVVRAVDGREAATTLTRSILGAVGVKAAEDLIPWTAAAGKADIAALAPVVLGEADSGDVCARAIAEEAGRELAEQVDAVVRRAGGWAGEIPIAFAGGLISPGGPLRSVAIHSLDLVDARYALREEPIDAARGAALIALADGGT